MKLSLKQQEIIDKLRNENLFLRRRGSLAFILNRSYPSERWHYYDRDTNACKGHENATISIRALIRRNVIIPYPEIRDGYILASR